MKKMITIIEFPSFLAQIGKSMTATERDEFIDFLAKNPNAGDEITGTGGIRKIRWGGKGKGEKENLTSEQKKQMSVIAKILKAECKVTRRYHHD